MILTKCGVVLVRNLETNQNMVISLHENELYNVLWKILDMFS